MACKSGHPPSLRPPPPDSPFQSFTRNSLLKDYVYNSSSPPPFQYLYPFTLLSLRTKLNTIRLFLLPFFPLSTSLLNSQFLFLICVSFSCSFSSCSLSLSLSRHLCYFIRLYISLLNSSDLVLITVSFSLFFFLFFSLHLSIYTSL